jgi:DNA polymerase III subunit delta'
MNLLANIRSQDNAVKYLSKSISFGRIANGYLFFGPGGVGKALTARSFIKTLMCKELDTSDNICECSVCRRIDGNNHPDVIWVKPVNSKAIKIEEIRQVSDKLNLKPYEADRIVCVIEEAHLMTREASNALLKVLEEPPGRSLIMLLSDKRELLLSTVISRCVEVRFGYVSLKDSTDIIFNNIEVTREKAAFLAGYSGGSPGYALEVEEKGLLARREEVFGALREISNGRRTVSWISEDKEILSDDIELLIMIFRDLCMFTETGGNGIVDQALVDSSLIDKFGSYSVNKIRAIIGELIEIKRAIKGNANPKLVSQVLPGIFS